ncbi:MAG: metallophosphoesterase [Candidatus Cryptobacteroides sp.]
MDRINFLRLFATIAAAFFTGLATVAQTPEQWKEMKGDINLFVANDLGRNGYYDQKPIAEMMGEMAEEIGPEAILAIGDVHHFNGVQSVSDPLWMTNYELVYSHPELMIAWYPVLGNHEYRGNTQAVLDYAGISRRWRMEGRYYSKVFEDDGLSVRIVFIDTTPMIDRYHGNPTYPDIDPQDVQEQLCWIDSTLNAATEDWVIVAGHHPMYAQTKKDEIEQADMQRLLLPILRKYRGKVSMYICGHIHNFQHFRRGGDGIDYIVNSSGSLTRPVSPAEGTVFCSDQSGFSVISATKERLDLIMVDRTGTGLHRVTKRK